MRPSAMACLLRPGLLRPGPFRSGFATVLLSSLVALTACGGAQESERKQVEMRDMDVVDGTINDSMTNLDAVRADGTALANGSANSADRPAGRAAQRAARDEVDEAEANAEAVAVD